MKKMYDTFDHEHNMIHINSVRNFAIELAEKYCPNKIEEVYVAATLHDIGMYKGLKDHNLHGYELIQHDKKLRDVYGEEIFGQILEAILEHTSPVGNPKSIIARIVSDADKVSNTIADTFKRSYGYGSMKKPHLTHEEQIIDCGKELEIRFAVGGRSTKVYFEESRKRLRSIYDPIIEAYREKNWDVLNSYLET